MIPVKDLKDFPTYHVVELPCLIKNEQLALDCIGGKDSASELLKNDTSIAFRFPGDNPLRGSLEGTLRKNPSILLKITRKRDKRTGKIVEQRSEVMGSINKTVHFPFPADYQFLPYSNQLSDYTAEEKGSHLNIPFELRPESISRVVHRKRPPQVLNFLSNSKLAGKPEHTAPGDDEEENCMDIENDQLKKDGDEENKAEVDIAEKRLEKFEQEEDLNIDEDQTKKTPKKGKAKDGTTDADSLAVIIKVGDPIPTSHPFGAHPPRWTEDHPGFELLERLHKIFAVFPVMAKRLLQEILGLGNKTHQFKEVLLYVAYTFASGPFQHLWFRYGYNPILDPTSRIYQQFIYKIHPKFLQDISERLMKFLGKERAERKTVSLDEKVLTDLPLEFSHSFIDKGAGARIPVEVFGYLIKQQMSIQFCRLMLDECMEFVEKASVLTSFHPQTGWYSAQSLDAFRSYAIDLISKLTNEFVQLTDIPFKPGPSSHYQKDYFDQVWPKIVAFMADPHPSLQPEDHPGIPSMIVWQRKYLMYAQGRLSLDQIRSNQLSVSTVKIPPLLSSKPAQHPTLMKHAAKQVASSNSNPTTATTSSSKNPSSTNQTTTTEKVQNAAAFQIFNDSDSEQSD